MTKSGPMTRLSAVLTGDLVKSRYLSLDQLERARDTLLGAADEVSEWKRGLLRGRLDFFRGDAWQMLLSDPKWALRAAVFLRASLLVQDLCDTRLVIGLGTVEKVNTRRISQSVGQAFMLSGQELDRLTQDFRMSIAVPDLAGAVGEWLRVVVRLCDTLIGKWTVRQAEIVRIVLQPDQPTHAEVAERLTPSVSKQAVTKALSSAEWQGLHVAIRQFEKTDWREVLDLIE
jgi:hypothetical protein